MVLLAGCNGGGDEAPAFTLDQSARVADAAGIVESAGREAIVLAGGGRFAVHPDLIAFSAQSADPDEVLPIAGFEGTFAQLGLDDDKKVVWATSFGPTLPDENGVETAYFTARVRKVSAGRIEFQRGIVVPLDDGVTTDAKAGQFVRAKIDPTTGRARALERP